LQLSDFGNKFPGTPFILRLGTSDDAKRLRVNPIKASDLQSGMHVVLACPHLELHGSSVPAVIGKLRIESRTDGASGESYLSLSVRGDHGVAQASLTEAEWDNLTSIGLIEELN